MLSDPFPLNASKIAVVTGGGSGINLAFVKLALQHNCKCLIADVKLTPEASEMVEASSGQALFQACDVTNWRDLEALPAAVSKAFGPDAVADVWIAGAGIFDGSSFARDDEQDGYRAIRVNAEHPIKLARVAMRSALGADKKAAVLVVSSMAGVKGQYAAAIYCASKHAVVGFVKSMAQADADEGIRLLCICPGIVATPLWTGEAAKREHDQFQYTDDIAIPVTEVAVAMKELIEDTEKYPGGSILGVSNQDPREVLESLRTTAVSAPRLEAWVQHTYGPMREVFEKERGKAM